MNDTVPPGEKEGIKQHRTLKKKDLGLTYAQEKEDEKKKQPLLTINKKKQES